MGTNNLSFSVSVVNNASTALNAIQRQVTSLKNGLTSIGSGTNSTTNYLNSLNRSANSSTRAFGSLGQQLKRTLSIFSGYKIINTIFNTISSAFDKAIARIDTMDLFEQKMTMITGSAENATNALESLKKSTKGTPYALDIAAKGVQNFVLRGMQTKDAVDSINIWMDAVSAYGKGTNEQFESVTDAIAKMRTKGTVEMRYLNRLFAAGINPVAMYAQATGQAAQDVQTALSNKEISSAEFLGVVEKAMREGTNGVLKIQGKAKALATTWAATSANMGIAIARGIVELINGVDEIAKIFSENGLKDFVKGFGVNVEEIFTGVGAAIGNVGKIVSGTLSEVEKIHHTYINEINRQVESNAQAISDNYTQAGENFKQGFFDAIAPYLDLAVLKAQDLRVAWSRLSVTFSKGINQISKPFATFVGTYLGMSINGVEDLATAFTNWLNLKLPSFFDRLEEILNWLIEHKDGVVGAIKAITKAFIGFKVLQTIEGVLIGFNNRLKMLNQTLAFFTMGKIQIPTLENLVLNKQNQMPKGSTVAQSLVNTGYPVAKGRAKQVKMRDGLFGIPEESTYFRRPSKTQLAGNWMLESMVNTGRTVKNKAAPVVKYVKDSTVATAKGTGEVFKESGLLLGAGLMKAKGGIGNFFKNVKGGFEKSTGTNISDIAKDVAEVSKSTKETAKAAPSKILGNLAGFFSGSRKGFESYTGTKTSDILKDFKDSLKSSWNYLNTDIQGNKTFTAQKFKNAGSAVTGGAKNLAGGVGNFFGTMFSGFKGLGQGQSATVALNGTEEATAQATTLAGILTKLQSGFGMVTQAVSSFVTTIAGTAIAVAGVTAAIGALVAGLGLLNPGNVVSNGINQFFTSFGEWCTTFAQNAPILIQSFVNGLRNNLPTLVTQGVNLLLSIVNGILTAIPKMLTVGASVIFALIGGLAQILPDLVYQGFNAIGQFIAGIIQNLPNILAAGWELIKTIVLGIVQNLPVIIASGVKIIWSLITGISSMVMQVFTAVKDLIVNAWNYLTSHPQEIWDAITGFCGELWNALLNGLYTAADMFNASWILDALGAQRPEVEQGGAETAQGAIDGATERLNNAGVDLSTIWNNANSEEAVAQAQQVGTDVASGFTDSVDAEMAQEAIDAGTAGTETATNYMSGMQAGVDAGNEGVNASLSSVGQEGLANLSVSFNSEQVAQAAAGLIANINNAILTNAQTVYMSLAVFAQNCVTQLAAGFAGSEQVPSAIATAMTSVVSSVSMQVSQMCTDIRAQLNSAKSETETTTSQLATAIQNNFTTAQITASASMQTMVDNLINQYNRLKDTVNTDLGAIETAHVNYAESTMNYYVSTINTNLDAVVQKYSDFDSRIRNILNALKDFHNQVAVDMMQGMINGFNSKMGEVTNKESELVTKLKDTFEKGLGIHSPSKYGEWIGQMLIAGMINGLSTDKLPSFVASIINDMKASFKAGNFNADELVDFLGGDGSLSVVKYLELIGDQTVSDLFGDGGVPPIIQEALKYVGYAPGGGNSMFGLYYGNPGAWCASFVRYCAEKVGVPFPPTNYVPDVLDWSIANGKYTTTPQPGYAAIFGGGSHIELVAGVGNGTVDMVGGNTGMGEVKHRPRSDATSYVALDGGHSTMTLKDTIMQAYNKKFNPLALMVGGVGTPAGYDPSGGAEQWRGTVIQALGLLGQPTSLVDGILYAIQCESGGNPNAINLTDINAQNGHPSQGLLQTIPSTFAAYRNPSLANNITDPLANIYAGLNYMIQRYGSIANVINPRMGGWYGYSVGTRYVPDDMLAMIHKGEAILPAGQNPYSSSGGDYLADLALNMFGDQGLSGIGFDLDGVMGGSTTNNSSNVNQNNTFNITNNSDVDGDRNIRNLELTLHNMLQEGRIAGSSR